MANSSDLRSKLGKVKGLGTAHHGTGHWWWQRVTAVALVPLSIWFAYSLITVMLTPDVIRVAEWFSSPVHSVCMVLLLLAMFFHAKLGVQVIIEDYIHSPFMKYALLMFNIFICALLAVLSTLAVLKLHFLDIISGTM